MTMMGWVADRVMRAMGAIIAPVLLILLATGIGDLDDSFESVFVAAMIGGVLAGMLLRSWGSVVLVPAEILLTILLIYIGDAANGGLTEGEGGDPFPLAVIMAIFTFAVALPAALGAAVGTQLGKRIEEAIGEM